MSLDLTNKSTYNVVYDNILCKNGRPNDDDCLGRTALAFIAYKYMGFLYRLSDFHETIGKKRPYVQAYRKPNAEVNDVSRDHVSYLLMAYKYAKLKELKPICKHLRWKLSDKHNMTLDFWLWTRALYSSVWREIFFAFQCLHLSVMSAWNGLLMRIMDISPEHTQETWDIEITHNRTERQKKLTRWTFPAYAVHNLAWQLYVLDRKPWLLRKIVLTMTGRTNYLVRMLLGGKVTKEEVYNYQSMTSYRWSTRLDETNDRHLEILPPQEANDFERDLLIEMYKEIK